LQELHLQNCNFYFLDGEVDDYKLPFDEVGSRPTLQELQDYVVTKKMRPIIKQNWREHPQGAIICSTIEEMWDTDPEARVSAGLAYVRLIAVRSSLQSSKLSLPNGTENETRNVAERSPLISDLQPQTSSDTTAIA